MDSNKAVYFYSDYGASDDIILNRSIISDLTDFKAGWLYTYILTIDVAFKVKLEALIEHFNIDQEELRQKVRYLVNLGLLYINNNNIIARTHNINKINDIDINYNNNKDKEINKEKERERELTLCNNNYINNNNILNNNNNNNILNNNNNNNNNNNILNNLSENKNDELSLSLSLLSSSFSLKNNEIRSYAEEKYSELLAECEGDQDCIAVFRQKNLGSVRTYKEEVYYFAEYRERKGKSIHLQDFKYWLNNAKYAKIDYHEKKQISWQEFLKNCDKSEQQIINDYQVAVDLHNQIIVTCVCKRKSDEPICVVKSLHDRQLCEHYIKPVCAYDAVDAKYGKDVAKNAWTKLKNNYNNFVDICV